MRTKSGIILPADGPHVGEYVGSGKTRSGCRKRRQRRERDSQTHCVCGGKLRTRHGETRCPVHGTTWSAQYWELAGVTVTEETYQNAAERSN